MHPGQARPRYELTVLGDLHGCYSCLKAALLQADFFAKVEAWKLDKTKPEPKLVLLGDYIDRGMFSYNGVLRTVMQLYLAAPEHVFMLRGNHEYYIEYRGRIYGGVKPAEAINTLIGLVPGEVFQEYMKLFEAAAEHAVLRRPAVRPRRHPARRRHQGEADRTCRRSTIRTSGSRCCGAIRRRPTSSPTICRRRTRASRSARSSSKRSWRASAAR